jgi:hypothetical protein
MFQIVFSSILEAMTLKMTSCKIQIITKKLAPYMKITIVLDMIPYSLAEV